MKQKDSNWKDFFQLYYMGNLGILAGMSLSVLATAPYNDELALQKFMELPRYEARSYVPYENSEKQYLLDDLFIVRYKEHYYLTSSNLMMIGSDVSFSVVSEEENRGYDKQIMSTDIIPFTSLEVDFKDCFSVVEAYDILDTLYDELDFYYEIPDTSISQVLSKNRSLG